MKQSTYIIIFLLLVIIYNLMITDQYSFLERFALSGTVVTDISQLDPTKFYLVGTRTKSNIKSPAQNGGTECPDYPVTIYKEAAVVNADCISPTAAISSVPDDTFYSYGTSSVPGVVILPRFFTTNITFNIPITSTTNDNATKSISYNLNGQVLLVGETSGNAYWSSNFGASNQSFNVIPSGVVKFDNASLGMGNVTAGGRSLPTNDKLIYAGTLTGGYAPIQNRTSYYYGTQQAIGTVPNIQGHAAGTYDNIFMTIGLDGNVFLQQQGSYYYKLVWSQQPGKASSISLDKTVATIVQYKPASGTTLASSIIFMVSLQPGGNVANAPGGIGAEISTLNTVAFKKVLGSPNNISYVCAGEDLRAFAVDADGNILICNNITTASTPSDWIILPKISSVVFSKVFYRQTSNDIAYALDVNGKVYVQKGVNAMFKQLFNLIA